MKESYLDKLKKILLQRLLFSLSWRWTFVTSSTITCDPITSMIGRTKNNKFNVHIYKPYSIHLPGQGASVVQSQHFIKSLWFQFFSSSRRSFQTAKAVSIITNHLHIICQCIQGNTIHQKTSESSQQIIFNIFSSSNQVGFLLK